MKGEIIAAGGHWSEWQKYTLAQIDNEMPRVGFLPTATGDSQKEIDIFYQSQEKRSSKREHLSLFQDSADNQALSWIREQDLIILPGGREEVARAAWKEEGLIEALRNFWQEGGVILASEEGAGLLFSLSLDRHANPFRGFSFLQDSFCLNYTNYSPVYRDLVARQLMPPGYGLSRGAALHFKGEDLWRSLAFNTLFDVFFVDDGRERAIDMTLVY